MRRTRNVKVVVTLGPASKSPDMIHRLFLAGADVFRLNMSHGSHEDMVEYHSAIRKIEKDLGRPIGILADLQGPKLRIGGMKDNIILKEGCDFYLDLIDNTGDQLRACFPHQEVFETLQVGMLLLIDDGKIRLEIKEVLPDKLHTVIKNGGPLASNKGVNVPDAILPVRALSEKDKIDIEFCMRLGVDWVALSFVQRAEDITEARDIIGDRAWIMAKMEKPLAMEHLDEIIKESDGIMVARGDLGVELPVEKVPGLQKSIVGACREAGKPVVVATQMLESMVDSAGPTRAEVSDVATAVFEGVDAVMLSAESAVGNYPAASVAMMNSVANSVQNDSHYRSFIERALTLPETTSADAITRAARQVAETIKASSIICYTNSGSTALRASRERPDVPILVLTPRRDTARRMAIVWGVHCVETEDASSFRDMVDKATSIAKSEEISIDGSQVIITAGVPFGTPGGTNILRIATI